MQYFDCAMRTKLLRVYVSKVRTVSMLERLTSAVLTHFFPLEFLMSVLVAVVTLEYYKLIE